jgi:hypothetical protein
MEDYPAGHSMDSTWFAVDESGEVAFFDTSEGGAIPSEGFPVGGEGGDGPNWWEVAFALLIAQGREDEELAAVLPETAEDLGEWFEGEQGAELQLLLSLGVHVYLCGEQDAYPYFRIAPPRQPLSLSDLPEGVKAYFTPGRLPLRFADSPQIAPGQFVPVESWSGYWFDTRGNAHPTGPESQRAAEQAQQFVEEEFPEGIPDPSGDYWENLRPLDRHGLLSLLRQLREVDTQRTAELEAKKSMVAARTRAAQRPRGLAGFFQRLFGGRRL